MYDYNVYDEVAREAAADYEAERPFLDDDRPTDAELAEERASATEHERADVLAEYGIDPSDFLPTGLPLDADLDLPF